MSCLFSFSRYQTKCVTEFLFRQLMMSWTLRFIFEHPPKQWPAGRKRGKERNAKIWISRERKELFRWNKKHSSYFLKGYHLVKKYKFDENSGQKLSGWFFLHWFQDIFMVLKNKKINCFTQKPRRILLKDDHLFVLRIYQFIRWTILRIY